MKNNFLRKQDKKKANIIAEKNSVFFLTLFLRDSERESTHDWGRGSERKREYPTWAPRGT